MIAGFVTVSTLMILFRGANLFGLSGCFN